MTKKDYHKKLQSEIENDPIHQGYDDILKIDYKIEGDKLFQKGRKLIEEGRKLVIEGNNLKDERCKFMKIAEKLNEGRAKDLDFPIVRTNTVRLVLSRD